MPQSWKTVNLVGRAGADVTILPRDRGDEPPPALLEGALNKAGRLMIRLPQEYFVVLHEGPTIPLDVSAVPDGVVVELRTDPPVTP